MNTPISTTGTVSVPQPPPKESLFKAIGSPLRCALLAEMSGGEPRMIAELARKFGLSPGTVSKHLAVLRRAGLIELSRRNYQIPRYFIADASRGHLDYGHCLLRLNGTGAQPAA